MKNIKSLLFIAFSICIIILSCDKDDIEIPKKYYLSKVYEESSLIMEVSYNPDMNVNTLMMYLSYFNIWLNITYEYLDNGRLYKIKLYEDDFFLAYDTIIYNEENLINKTIRYVRVDTNSYDFLNRSETEFEYDSKGNIIKEIKYHSDNTDFIISSINEFEYDDKINPLQSLNLRFTEIEYISKNNWIKKIKMNSNRVIFDIDTATYQYNSKGYPVKQILEYGIMEYEYIIKQ